MLSSNLIRNQTEKCPIKIKLEVINQNFGCGAHLDPHLYLKNGKKPFTNFWHTTSREIHKEYKGKDFYQNWLKNKCSKQNTEKQNLFDIIGPLVSGVDF